MGVTVMKEGEEERHRSLFPPPLLLRIYRVFYGNRSNKAVKLLPWSAICVLLFLRCCVQFLRYLAPAAVVLAAACWAAGSWLPALALATTLELLLLCYLLGHPDANAGHRAGAEGYEGEQAENTVEALRALVAADRGPEGPLPGLVYIEIDVQETADGEVVVFHDTHLAKVFGSCPAALDLARDLRNTSIKDLTWAQLSALPLPGPASAHVPSLEQFLQACMELQLHRPLVVEVKALHSDQGRQRLLQLLRSYAPTAAEAAAMYPHLSYGPMGHLGVISFPFLFASAFGEYGSAPWRRWAREFNAIGVPVRSCCCHALSLVHV